MLRLSKAGRSNLRGTEDCHAEFTLSAGKMLRPNCTGIQNDTQDLEDNGLTANKCTDRIIQYFARG